ncbi:antitoxin Xre/MbcA/ParS toxin-binding domain-containing protein [Variovorax sp. YR216]|uniref:antitoxin Xre/MbcA/ParS toxin-binding domain-containing protein n=1 Tax=Variovorax sp. YR216 TaxID=1882828 RepID=UPI00089BFBBE|nr:MbcA/ParS/Xre antitoxin family protein [Variovorax sp. YR216]SEB08673.1 putative toxin-antitoxin system antitoxin component, TIGR02293 family [Variovorax sp. YR216]
MTIAFANIERFSPLTMTASPAPSKRRPAKARQYPGPAGSAIVAVAAEDVAAHGQAAKFQRVFESAYGAEAQRRLWVVFSDDKGAGHAALLFDRGQAAELASHPVQARVIDEWFAASGLERRKDLQIALNLTPSMLSRKGSGDKDLDASVTERMLRHSDLLVRAAEVFGEDGPAWMTKPHPVLDGKTPLEFASNEFGAERVREILNAIEYGGVV